MDILEIEKKLDEAEVKEEKKGRGRPKKSADVTPEQTIAGLSAEQKSAMLKEIAQVTCTVLDSIKFGDWSGWNNEKDNEVFAAGFLPVTEKYFPSFFDLGGIPEFTALCAAFTIYQSKKSQYLEAKNAKQS